MRGSSIERATTATAAAHLLTEAGSAAVRALDLLRLTGWRPDESQLLNESLTEAVRIVTLVRVLLDARLAELAATLAGDAPRAAAERLAAERARELLTPEVPRG